MDKTSNSSLEECALLAVAASPRFKDSSSQHAQYPGLPVNWLLTLTPSAKHQVPFEHRGQESTNSECPCFCGAHVAAPYLTFVEQGTNPQSTVGQSGCTSSKSSLGISESPPGTRVAGEVLFSEENNGKARDGNNFEDGDTWRFPESKIPYPLSGGSGDPRCATSESDPCPT